MAEHKLSPKSSTTNSMKSTSEGKSKKRHYIYHILMNTEKNPMKTYIEDEKKVKVATKKLDVESTEIEDLFKKEAEDLQFKPVVYQYPLHRLVKGKAIIYKELGHQALFMDPLIPLKPQPSVDPARQQSVFVYQLEPYNLNTEKLSLHLMLSKPMEFLFYFLKFFTLGEYDLLTELVLDLDKNSKEDDFSEFTEKVWKVLHHLDNKGSKHPELLFLPLKFVKITYDGKLGHEMTELIPKIEICSNDSSQKKEYHLLHDSFARFFALLVVNLPMKFLNLPKKAWSSYSEKIVINILNTPQLQLEKTTAENILLLLLESSSNWDSFNANLHVSELVKLYSLYAKDFRTFIKNTKSYSNHLPKILELEEALIKVTEKLIAQAKEENTRALDILNQVKEDILEKSFVRIAKKLLCHSRSIQEIEELFFIVGSKDEKEIWTICEEIIPKALKEMSLQSLAKEIRTMNATRNAIDNSKIVEEFQNKFESHTLDKILDLREELTPVLKEFPGLVKPLLQRVTGLVKNEKELADLGGFLAMYSEFLVEDENYWGKEGPIGLIKLIIHKVIGLTSLIKTALEYFEPILSFYGNDSDKSKELCNYFWETAFAKFGKENLFKNLPSVSQKVGTDEIKGIYCSYLIKKLAPATLSFEKFDEVISILFPGEAMLIDLKDPLMDQVFSRLLERLQPPSDIFSIIPQLDQYHAWAKILCFQNGEKFQKVEQYQEIRKLLSSTIDKIISLTCTISEAGVLSHLSEDQIKVFHENYIKRIHPDMDCKDSFKKIKEIYTEANDSKQHLENILEKYMKKTAEYSFVKDLCDKYCIALPSVLIKNYQDSVANRPFEDIPEKIYRISGSQLFNQKFEELLTKERPKVQDILKCLKDALSRMEEEVKNVLISEEPVSAEFIEETLSGITTYEQKKDEIKLLAQCFGLKDLQKEALLKFVEVMRKKDRFLKNIDTITKFAETKGFVSSFKETMRTSQEQKIDQMIIDLSTIETRLKENKIAFMQMVEVFNSGEETHSFFLRDEKLLEVLEIYVNEEALLRFVLQKDESEIRNMIEMIGDFGDLTIKASEIAYLFELKTLFDTLSIVKGETLKETLAILQSKIQDPNFPDVIKKMNFCKEHLSLLEQLANKKEALSAIIRNVVTKGIVKISLKRSSYTARLTTGGSAPMKEVKIDEAIQIRDRVHLTLKADEMMKSHDNQWTSDKMKEFQNKFIEIIDLIVDILMILNGLYQKGYPKLQKKFDLDCHNKEDLLIEKEKLETCESDWDELIRDAYLNYYVLTLLYGRQFNKLLEYLQKKPATSNQEAQSILRHVFGKRYGNLKLDDFPAPSGGLDEKFQDLGKYLEDKLHSKRNFSVCQELNNVKKKILIVASAATLIECVCTMHLQKAGELPTLSNCLYCHKNTSFEEIYAFVRRYIQCPNKALFSVLRIEDLDGSCQERFVQLLTRENESIEKRNILAVLAILVADVDAPIAKQLKTLGFFQESVQAYDETKFEYELKQILNTKIFIVDSEHEGIGKSQWINQTNEKWAYFPISGSVNFRNILKRLTKLDIPQGSSFHIDIGHVIEEDNKMEIDRILFSLMVLGGISSFEYLFTLPEDCHVFIELHKLSPKIPFLKLLKSNWVKIDKLQKINPKYIPASRLVFNVLALYDKGNLPKADFSVAKIEDARIDAQEAQRLLDKYFISQVKTAPNYYKIKIFLLLAADLFSRFTKSVFFFNSNLSFAKLDKQIKNIVCEAIIEYSREYTVRSIDYAMNCQANALENGGNGPELDMMNASMDNLGFESMKNFSLIFDDAGCCIPIYKDDTQVPKKFMDLLKSQRLDIYQPPTSGKKSKPNFKTPFELENYVQLTSNSLIDKLCEFIGIVNPKEREFLYEACKNYVMTADNFFKMCLLITKCRARIPVIIMGQAGCGKTSLVQFLAEKILKENFRKINFHAGITPKILYKKLKQIWEEAELLKKEGKKLWLFLDEINTSETLNLVKEMMTYDSYEGVPIVDNIQYIAAINPYSKRSKKDVGLLVRKKFHRAQELQYNVLPLPESLFNFVWDFGHLSVEDEKSYINQMLRNVKMGGEIRDISLNCMIESHNFIREREGLGSVSLRDTKRFIVIYNWFCNSLEVRRKFKEEIPRSYSQNISGILEKLDLSKNTFAFERDQMQAIVLTLAICYYTRLENPSDRSAYLHKISKVIKSSGQQRFANYDTELMLEIIEAEQKEYLERIKNSNNQDLMKGIAYNTALKENIFTMLVCLMNRIPVIICGEPGCSKTLSFQLLLNSLRGPDSVDEYFRTLPRLLVFTYQGSYQSTSEGIIRVFEKAQRVLEENYQQPNSRNQEVRNIISVVFFDEMGLAELSKNNPLKVLHSLLEYNADTTEEDLKMRVGFVGISNWRLDMSKMSRVIFVARSQPTLPDLKETADSIIKSFERYSLDVKTYTQILAETYFEFRKEFEHTHKKYQNFHGLRDFYSLMKETCKALIKKGLEHKSTDTISECINAAIERNFGGLPDSVSCFKRILKRRLDYLKFTEIPVRNLIQLNFEDPEARYLMLILRGNIGSQIIADQLNMGTKKYNTIIGSQFEQDIDQDEYSAKILSTIINCLEDGVSLILQGLDTIYPSLYDLFNQNFTVISKKKSCKIALARTTNITCSVHDEFRCIVLVDEQELADQEPPFLNRFEKQIISWESILSDRRMIPLFGDVKAWLTHFCTSGILNQKFVLSPQWLIVNFSEENLACIVAGYWNSQEKTSAILTRIKKEILMTASADIIPAACRSQGADQKEELLKYYYKQPHQSLTKFLEVMREQIESNQEGALPLKSVVYTYSTTFDPLGLNKIDEYDEYKLSSISSERELDSVITRFFETGKLYFFLRLKAEADSKYFALAKLQIERLVDKYQEKLAGHKHLVVIFHLNRKDALEGKPQPLSMAYMKGWNQIMIDSLQEVHYVNFESIIELDSKEILNKKRNLIRTHQSLTELVTDAYLKLNFKEYSSTSENFPIKDRIDKVINLLSANEEIRETIFDKVNAVTSIDRDWVVEIVTDKQLLASSKDIYHALEKFFGNKLQHSLLQLVYSLETTGGMKALLSLAGTETNDKQTEILFNGWVDIFKKTDHSQRVIQKHLQNIVKKIHDTRIPFAFKDIMNCFECLQINDILQEYKGFLINFFEDPEDRNFQDSKFQQLQQTEKIIEESVTLSYIKNLPHESYEWRLCLQLLQIDIGTIFTIYFLKSEEKYAELIITLMQDIVKDAYFFSESIITLLALRRVLRTLIDLHKYLSIKNSDIPALVKSYNEIKAKNKSSPVFENILRAITKDIYPTKEAVQRVGSWKKYSFQLSNTILHIQIICKELDTIMDIIKLFTFWRDLIEVCETAEYTDTQIDEETSKLMEIQEIIQTDDYQYQEEAFPICCRIFENLFKKLTPENNQKFLALFSRFLVDSYKKLRHSPVGIEVIKKALSYDYLASLLGSFLETVLKDANIEFTNKSILVVENENILSILDQKLMKVDRNSDLVIHLDFLLCKIYIPEHFDQLKDEGLKISPDCLKTLWNELGGQEEEKISVRALGIVGVMKYLIGEYTESLVDSAKYFGSEAVLSADDCVEIENILSKQNNLVAASLRVYALRNLWSKVDDLSVIIENNLNQVWLRDLKNVQNEQKKYIYSGIGKDSRVSQFREKFDTIIQNSKNEKSLESSMSSLIKEMDKADVCTLSFFYNHSYWKFLLNEKPASPFSPEKLQSVLGAAKARILQSFTKNFDKKYELLHLSPSQSAERIKITSIICHISIGIISKVLKSKKPSVYSFLIENNSFEGLAARLASSVIPDAEFQENPTASINTARESIDIYSSRTTAAATSDNPITSSKCSCGFVYYYSASSDLAKIKFNCPICKRTIDNPTKFQYLSQFSKGMTGEYLLPVNLSNITRKNYTVRTIKPFTYRILSLILHSLLYFVLAIGGVSDEALCKLMNLEPNTNCEELLRYCIESHWRLLAQMLELQENGYLFLHEAVDQLIEKKVSADKFKHRMARNVWEIEVEREILDPLVNISGKIVSGYSAAVNPKKILQELEEEKGVDPAVAVVISIGDFMSPPNDYPYIHFMRIPRSNTFELFENAFRRLQQQEEFPLTNLYLRLKDPLECISSLKQIISFTNTLTAQFHLRRLRCDATNQTIGQWLETQSKEIHAEWKAFLTAWNRICLILHKGFLQKFRSFSEESKIISLFPEESMSEVNPICEAFYQLSGIQNTILHIISNNQKIISKYPHLQHDPFPITQIQDAAEGNLLLGMEISKQIETIIELTSYPESNDNSQGRLTYNWNAVEESLTRNFLIGKHLLSCEKIRVIQFKGELPRDPDADIVRSFTSIIPQQQTAQVQMSAIEGRLRKKTSETIENLYTSLSIILVHLTKSKFEGHLTLETVCKSIRCENLPYDIARDGDLKDLRIDSFIQLYEKVEEIVYPQMESLYTNNFNKELKGKQESTLVDFILLSEEKGFLEMILQGLRRFVVRYLDESLTGTQELKLYLAQKEGLWPADKREQMKIYIAEHFPSVIFIENTIAGIKKIADYIENKQRKPKPNGLDERDPNPLIPEPIKHRKPNRDTRRDRNFL